MRRSQWMVDQLSAQVRAQEAMDEREYEKARDLLLELLTVVERAGAPAGHVHWMLCVTFDNLGDLPMAMTHIEKALEVDPLSVPFHRSFDIITNRLRAALVDESRTADDPSTPRLYDLLVRTGEADAASHLAMVRWCVGAGDLSRALRILESLTALDPFHHEAWATLATVARTADRPELAERAEIEAAATKEQGPSSIPSAKTARS